MATISRIAKFTDGIKAAFANIGNEGAPIFERGITPLESEAAYRTNWIVRKAIDLPPWDETREWRDWQADKPQIELLEAEEKRLGYRAKVRQARRLQRLTGGAAIVLGVNPRHGAPDTELNVGMLKKGDLQFLHVLPGGVSGSLNTGDMVGDILSPYYGQPSKYELTGQTTGGVDIHPSRVIPFVADRIVTATENWFWGDPLLRSIWSAVNNAALAQDGFADLINEAKVDVYGVEGLTEMASTTEGESRISRRFSLANEIKRRLNILIIDSRKTGVSEGDTWQQKQITWTGMPEIIDRYMQIVCGAVDIPASRFLSQAPAGMNSTGESDIRNYYDRISAGQENELRPMIERIDEALIRSTLGTRPPEIHFTFAPLWQLSATEKATNFKTMTEGVNTLDSTQLVPTIALEKGVQNWLTEEGVLPGLDGALAELGEEERFPSQGEDDEDDLPVEEQVIPLRRAANDKQTEE